jgi:hypothetical protein
MPPKAERRRLQVGEPLPARMAPADMQQAFDLGHTRFQALVNAGHFDRFEILPRIGNRAWSGEKVARYLAGERPDDGRVWGRKLKRYA